MKKITYLIVASTLMINANYSIKEIENMVVKIHNKRVGIDSSVLNQTKEPFISKVVIKNSDEEVPVVIPDEPKVENKIELHAILGDKAYLNNRWLKVNEFINGYELKYIGKRGVVLQNGNIVKKLLFKDSKNSLIKIEGR
jgi:rRNA processing protein Gar1